MPKFLENKLKSEYGNDSSIPYKIMNALGAMRGNKETPKGRAMQAKHDRDTRSPDAANAGALINTARASRKGFRFPGGAKPTLSAIIGVKTGLKTGLRTGLKTRYA